MPSDRKNVKVQYRRLNDEGNFFGNCSLHAAICEAISKKTDAGTVSDHPERRAHTEDLDFGTVLLNYMHQTENLFFGELIRFEPGAQLPLLHLVVENNSYNLRQASAPEGHEAIKGFLYFMVHGNHVTLIENDLTTGRLERYMRWLLTKATSTIPAAAGVSLEPELMMNGAQKKLPEVKEARITSKILSLSSGTQEEIADFASEKHTVSQPRLFEVLRAAGLDSADIEAIVQDQTYIQLTLHLKFKQGRRTKAISETRATRLFRNVDPDDLELYGPGGREKGGQLVKMAYDTVVLKEGTLLSTTDVARALREAYVFFVENGHIEP